MKDLVAEIGTFLHTLLKSWVSLMSGIVGVAAWAIGALAPMPLSVRWIFLACGTIALLVANFLVWRTAYRTHLNRDARLALTRLADDGNQLIANLETSTKEQKTTNILQDAVALEQWRQECKQTIETHCPQVLKHCFHRDNTRRLTDEDEARLLIRRIRQVLDVLGSS